MSRTFFGSSYESSVSYAVHALLYQVLPSYHVQETRILGDYRMGSPNRPSHFDEQSSMESHGDLGNLGDPLLLKKSPI